jgi:hypothetical protein
MKFRKFALASIAAATMAFVTPANANTLTFQGVTFETLASGSTLQLTITNALSGGTGNWANVNYLKAFEIKGIGDVSGATLAGWTTNVNNGLASAAGCTTGGTPGACFYTSTAFALTDLMTFSIDFAGTNLNFDAPHLKVQFLTGQYDSKATGDLLSQTIPAIPEPEIYAMMAIGMGVVGWAARRKKLKATAAA